MVFAATLERVDMRLLGIIVVVLCFCPSIHGVACDRKPQKRREGGKKGKKGKGRKGEGKRQRQTTAVHTGGTCGIVPTAKGGTKKGALAASRLAPWKRYPLNTPRNADCR